MVFLSRGITTPTPCRKRKREKNMFDSCLWRHCWTSGRVCVIYLLSIRFFIIFIVIYYLYYYSIPLSSFLLFIFIIIYHLYHCSLTLLLFCMFIILIILPFLSVLIHSFVCSLIHSFTHADTFIHKSSLYIQKFINNFYPSFAFLLIFHWFTLLLTSFAYIL